jgi:hypothetical protein
MSAFDSAMLMIEDLTKQVVELEQQVWDLQLALWHERKRPKRWNMHGLPKWQMSVLFNCK